LRARKPREGFDKIWRAILSESANHIGGIMTSMAQRRFAAQARILKALAHPTRLFIVDELARGERCVCELTAMVGVEMPTVSRHLRQLKTAGIVTDEKRGPQVFYRLRVPCVVNFFKCVQAVQEDGKR
jgi:ArsR family transcriptional regulator